MSNLERDPAEQACGGEASGGPVVELLEELKPAVALFVDDLPVHHESVAKHAPHVWRLHMVAEPRVAAHTPASSHAHARIDDWETAAGWILDRFSEGPPRS